MPEVLGLGAFLKNRACRLVPGDRQGNAPQWSRMHDDLGDPAACMALDRTVQDWLAGVDGAAPCKPCVIAHDMHPDFYSTRLAVQQARTLGVPALAVQHHHAHVAAVMSAQGIAGPVLGVALDGFGLGSDGQAWGGEVLWVQDHRWRRVAHLSRLPMPGGDRAAREPWRMALGWSAAMHRHDAALMEAVGMQRYQAVVEITRKGLNAPLTSSAGRWFDAMAALLGLCLVQQDEAQAAIALEGAAREGLARHPGLLDCDLGGWAGDEASGNPAMASGPSVLNMHACVEQAIAAGSTGEAAALFHLGLADGLAHYLTRAADALQVADVCLGGGCFFNRILRERLVQRLQAQGLRVLLAGDAAHGDAHLALGQAWVAQSWWRHEGARLARPAAPDTVNLVRCDPLETQDVPGPACLCA